MSGPGPYTVFAPNNDAFSRLDIYLQDNFGVAVADVLADQELLTDLLSYHVVNGNVFSSQLTDGQIVPTIYPGTGIGVIVADGTVSLNNGVADVVTADVAASNGVVHVIDNVLFNGTIADDITALAERLEQEALVAELGNSIAGVIAQSPDHTILFQIAQLTGLDALLTDGFPFTVFAPTDAAFTELVESLGFSIDDALGQPDLLATILRYHIGSGEFGDDALFALDGGEIPTILNEALVGDGDPIYVDVILNVAGGVQLNGEVNTTTGAIEANNGFVYVVDSVLVPNEVRELLGLPLIEVPEVEEEAAVEEEVPEEEVVDYGNSISGIVSESEDFSILWAVIEATGNQDLLNTGFPFTVFAPTDAAFEALLEQLGIPVEVALEQADLLDTVLRYHIISDEVPAEVVLTLDGQEVATILNESLPGDGDTIAIAVADGAVVLNGSVNVTETDIIADNGIIHAVDAVLLPAEVLTLLGLN